MLRSDGKTNITKPNKKTPEKTERTAIGKGGILLW